MAKSKYEYVKLFEQHDVCLPNTFMVIRIDGKGFSKFTTEHKYEKPNDVNGLNLMNNAAIAVMTEFKDIFLAYGQSDEFSFVFKKEADVYKRRKEKIVSTVVSIFTARYIFDFEKVMGRELKYLPAFDCRMVLFPDLKSLRDCFSWRQVDCHINNLYNTCFWSLVQKGKKTNKQAENILRDTVSEEKHDLLFNSFGINYNNEQAIYRKGSLLRRDEVVDEEKMKKYEEKLKEGNCKVSKPRAKKQIVVLHEDLIKEEFWKKSFPFLYS